MTAQGSNADLPAVSLPPPRGVPADYVHRYTGDAVFDLWVNVNVSPDLPVVSRVIADRWQHATGQKIDGVVALDSEALADILRGSPPIQVDKAPPLTSANIVDYLAVGQYRDFPTDPTGSNGVDTTQARKQLLVTISKAATARLTTGGGSTLELLKGLAAAVGEGHLRMASDDPALQKTLHDAGIDGALPEGPAPVAYPVVFNSSGGKLEHFLDRAVTYTAGSCEKKTRSSRITVALTNQSPAGLPDYLANPAHTPGQPARPLDRITLMVFGTRGATLTRATIDGRPLFTDPNRKPYVDSSTEAGLPVWQVVVDLPAGVPQTIVLDLTEPTAHGAARVPEQPLARPLRTKVRVPSC